MTQGFGNEPGDSLNGNHRGWFIGVIPSFPAEDQQDRQIDMFMGGQIDEWMARYLDR